MGWSGAWAGFSEVESQVMRAADEAAAIAWCIEKFGADGSGFHSASDFTFAEPDNALFAYERAGPAIEAAVNEAFWQGVLGYAQDAFVQGPPAPGGSTSALWPCRPTSFTASWMLRYRLRIVSILLGCSADRPCTYSRDMGT